MKLIETEYNTILNYIENVLGSSEWAEKLYIQFPMYDQLMLSSIYSQCMQKRVKKIYHKVTHPEKVQKYYKRYLNGVDVGEFPGIILKIARDYAFSPAMMAKVILEHHLNTKSTSDKNTSVTKSQVNKLLRDTTLIQDKELSYEVYLCLLHDDIYGPYADSIKHSLGQEYEFCLKTKLDDLKIGYFDEDKLRKQGYDKTPDFKLDVPIAIDGKVINWIESKASFGDEDNHKHYLKEQFWSYWNRFGSGLVIYWFGFIEELDEHEDKGILLRDHFPNNITVMDPMVLRPATP